jgi:olefin beta-lactone synthetase
MLLTYLFQQPASKTAIIEGPLGHEQRYSYGDLLRVSAALAEQLQAAGIGANNRVIVLLPMSFALYASIAAIWRLGAVVMVVDPGAGLGRLADCLRRFPPKAVVGGHKAKILRLILPTLRKLPWLLPQLLGSSSNILAVSSADTPALLTFTSGSSGQPKAALRTQGFLAAQLAALDDLLYPVADSLELATLPVVALANLAQGRTVLIPNVNLRRVGQIKAAVLVRQLQQQQVASITASPALLARVADYCLAHKLRLNALRRILAGGGPVTVALMQRLAAIAPQAEVWNVYGSTEAEPIAHIKLTAMHQDDLEASQKHGQGLLVGLPVPQIQLRIIEHQGQSLPSLDSAALDSLTLAPNQVGEIIVSGEHVLAGYLDGLGDQENKIKVGRQVWHRTGDAGYLDRQGRLWLMGRAEARIHDERGLLYPFAVEVVAEANGAKRAALLSWRGKRILCLEGQAVTASVLENLAWAKLDQVRPVAHIPVDRRHNAKIDYNKLRKMLK